MVDERHSGESEDILFGQHSIHLIFKFLSEFLLIWDAFPQVTTLPEFAVASCLGFLLTHSTLQVQVAIGFVILDRDKIPSGI